MKHIHKSLALLLALLMLLSLAPAGLTAHAEEIIAELPPAETLPSDAAEEETVAPDALTGGLITTPTIPTVPTWSEPEVWIDPMYRDLVDPESLVIPQPDYSTTFYSDDPADYLPISEAAAQIRKGMQNRDEKIIVYVRTGNEDQYAVFQELYFDTALGHTGVSNEGDYLRWNNLGYSRSTINMSLDNDACYYIFKIYPIYLTTAAQEAEVTQAVDNLLNQLNLWDKSDYEKVRGVYDWICANITYDYENLGSETSFLHHSTYSAIIQRHTVCQGYATLLYRLLLELGVDTRVITSIDHGWNIVELGGLYYNADSTWDASCYQGGLPYEWFLRSPSNFPDHPREDAYTTAEFHAAYPMSSTDYIPGETSSDVSGCFDTIREAGIFIRENLANDTLEKTSDSVCCIRLGIAANVMDAYAETSQNGFTAAADDLWEVITEHTGVPTLGDYLEYNAGYSLGGFFLNETGDYYILDLYYGYGYTFDQATVMDQAVERLIAELDIENKSDYEKVRAIYDWMCLNIVYDDSRTHYDAYSALCRQTATCQGYASLFYRLCLEVGVDCRYCGGYTFDSWGLPVNHAWNVVRIDGTYYYVDTTWGANLMNGEPSYYYLLKGIDGLGDHLIVPSRWEREIGDYCSVSPTDFPIPESKMILLQGACSDTVRFSLNKAGVLTISGTGSIPKYYYGDEGTHHGYWSYGYSDFIRKLVIEEGITKIEKDAFCGMNIAEVSLPDSLVTLEDYALDSNDFISIRIPANLRDIGLCAIRSINLFNISVDPANPYYDTWDNNLVSKDRKTLVVYGNRFDQGQLCSSYSIPEGIEVIGKSAFCGVRSFENVFFPETVISIEEEAFALCSYATFQLPESLESIGKRAFLNCLAYTNIYLGKNVRSLGECVFDSRLKSITVHPNNNWFVTVDGVLFSKDMKQLIKYPSARTDIPTSYTIPEGVEEIRERSCGGLYSLDTIIFPESLISIGEAAFEGLGVKELNLPSNLQYIGEGAFRGCTAVNAIVIPDSVKEIGTDAFFMNGAETILLGRGIEHIGSRAFKRDGYAMNNGNQEIAVFFSDAVPEFDSVSQCIQKFGLFAPYFGYQPTHMPSNNEGWRDEEGMVGLGAMLYVPISNLADWNGTYYPKWTPDKNYSWFYFPLTCYHYTPDGRIHTFESEITGALCEGLTTVTYRCTGCEESYEFTVDEAEHQWIDATCNRPKTCNRCGKTEGDNITHCASTTVLWGSVCSGFGYEVLICDWCGEELLNAVEVLGHDFAGYISDGNATCTQDGTKTNRCTRCGLSDTLPDVGSATGHDYMDVVTEPTCTTEGYTTHTCRSCGDSYTDDYTAPLGHSYGSWYVSLEPTCTQDGEERHDCTRCGHRETRALTAMGHDYNASVTPATCTEQGFTTHTCRNCGNTYVDTHVAALGHNFASYESDGNATCTQDGTKTGHCTRCGLNDTLPDVGSATGHDYMDVVTEPTCTTEGYTTHTCRNCGDTYVDSYIGNLMHIYHYAVTAEPTQQETGILWGTCELCGESKSVTLPKLNEEDYTYMILKAPTREHTGLARYTWNDTTLGEFSFDITLPVLTVLELGDVSGDGKIDAADACCVILFYQEQLDLDALQLAAADVNGDGRVDTADAYCILLFYTNRIPAFPADGK